MDSHEDNSGPTQKYAVIVFNSNGDSEGRLCIPIVQALSKTQAVRAVELSEDWCLDEVVGCLDIGDVEWLGDVLSSNSPVDIIAQ